MWRNSIALALTAVAIAAFEASAHSTGTTATSNRAPRAKGGTWAR